MPDGRILYTRWEYVDRSQVDYHHLWTANPDGTAQMVWYGNLHPGTVMIDAKPIPGSDKVVAIFSPGHGQREHAGAITVVDPKAGPDAPAFARPVSRGRQFRDPWAFSEDCFMAALGPALVVMDGGGLQQEIFKLPAAGPGSATCACTSRGPSCPAREKRILPDRTDPKATTGRLVLADIYHGRNMDGIRPRPDQEAPRARDPAQAHQLLGQHGADQLRRHLHAGAHPRHRPRRAGRLGLHGSARPAQPVLRGVGRSRTWP